MPMNQQLRAAYLAYAGFGRGHGASGLKARGRGGDNTMDKGQFALLLKHAGIIGAGTPAGALSHPPPNVNAWRLRRAYDGAAFGTTEADLQFSSTAAKAGVVGGRRLDFDGFVAALRAVALHPAVAAHLGVELPAEPEAAAEASHAVDRDDASSGIGPSVSRRGSDAHSMASESVHAFQEATDVDMVTASHARDSHPPRAGSRNRRRSAATVASTGSSGLWAVAALEGAARGSAGDGSGRGGGAVGGGVGGGGLLGSGAPPVVWDGEHAAEDAFAAVEAAIAQVMESGGPAVHIALAGAAAAGVRGAGVGPADAMPVTRPQQVRLAEAGADEERRKAARAQARERRRATAGAVDRSALAAERAAAGGVVVGQLGPARAASASASTSTSASASASASASPPSPRVRRASSTRARLGGSADTTAPSPGLSRRAGSVPGRLGLPDAATEGAPPAAAAAASPTLRGAFVAFARGYRRDSGADMLDVNGFVRMLRQAQVVKQAAGRRGRAREAASASDHNTASALGGAAGGAAAGAGAGAGADHGVGGHAAAPRPVAIAATDAELVFTQVLTRGAKRMGYANFRVALQTLAGRVFPGASEAAAYNAMEAAVVRACASGPAVAGGTRPEEVRLARADTAASLRRFGRGRGPRGLDAHVHAAAEGGHEADEGLVGADGDGAGGDGGDGAGGAAVSSDPRAQSRLPAAAALRRVYDGVRAANVFRHAGAAQAAARAVGLDASLATTTTTSAALREQQQQQQQSEVRLVSAGATVVFSPRTRALMAEEEAEARRRMAARSVTRRLTAPTAASAARTGAHGRTGHTSAQRQQSQQSDMRRASDVSMRSACTLDPADDIEVDVEVEEDDEDEDEADTSSCGSAGEDALDAVVAAQVAAAERGVRRGRRTGTGAALAPSASAPLLAASAARTPGPDGAPAGLPAAFERYATAAERAGSGSSRTFGAGPGAARAVTGPELSCAAFVRCLRDAGVLDRGVTTTTADVAFAAVAAKAGPQSRRLNYQQFRDALAQVGVRRFQRMAAAAAHAAIEQQVAAAHAATAAAEREARLALHATSTRAASGTTAKDAALGRRGMGVVGSSHAPRA